MTNDNPGSNELDRAMAEALEAVEKRERKEPEALEPEVIEIAEAGVEETAAAPAGEELVALKDQLLRMAADFDNYRKRTRRELEAAEGRGRERFALEMLPALDNLERALAHVTDDEGPLAEGVRMVARQFEDVLRTHGIVAFASIGEVFDPQWHEAMSQMPSAEHEPGTVVAELKKGYRAGEKLLRPAQVVVAMASAATPDDAGDGGGEANASN